MVPPGVVTKTYVVTLSPILYKVGLSVTPNGDTCTFLQGF